MQATQMPEGGIIMSGFEFIVGWYVYAAMGIMVFVVVLGVWWAISNILKGVYDGLQ